MAKVLCEKDGLIGRITLNRPEVMNAIDDDLPRALAAAVAEADHDPDVHVMVLSGAGKAFCSGYDLAHYAAGNGPNKVVQDMPWDPLQDYQFMWANTQSFMSLFRAMKPVICKVHGFAMQMGPILRSVPTSRSWATPRRLVICPRAFGVARPRRCGCIGLGQRRPSA